MERNFKLTLCYDGTRYRGWQRQGNTADTIQGTDAGVHAAAQVASFRADTDLSCDELLRSLRQYLPEDIGAISLEKASERFHARLSAREKTYVYRIWNSETPCVFERRYVYVYPRPLDTDSMERAGERLRGRHDFAAFSTGRKKGAAATRTLKSVEVSRQGDEIRLTYTADGFLYNMARILTGTLLEIGAGDRPAEEIDEIFASRNRERAGFTAPARGLCLLRVEY